MHRSVGFALDGVVRTHIDLDIAAAHAGHGGVKLAAFAVEQGDGIARLQAQHLHMACSARWQTQGQAGGQGGGAIKAGHAHMRP